VATSPPPKGGGLVFSSETLSRLWFYRLIQLMLETLADPDAPWRRSES